MSAPDPRGAGTRRSAVIALGWVLVLGACQAPVPQPTQPPDEDRLLDAAERIVSFLRGEAALEMSLVADSVTLYLAPEGGGSSRRVARPALRNLSSWQVAEHRLTPHPDATELTRRVGRHFNCLEYPLASRFEDLARMPHVGTKLDLPESESCMQTWNMTFVFDPHSTSPVLTAVVYDQWEW